NGIAGIQLSGGPAGYLVYGNKVGTDASGTSAIPNGTYGVAVSSGSNNVIGGLSAGQANQIAYNQTGVVIQGSAVHNPVRGNSIYANTTMGVDNSSGGNFELPAPAITSLAGKEIHGAACNYCTVDVYNDLGAQGRLYI